jgi:hypothetical protein
MEKADLLRQARDRMLALHKGLVDRERSSYEQVYGAVNAAQFLTALLEDKQLEWLRVFSTLIVDIDEMFAQKDGYSGDAVDLHLSAVRALINVRSGDEAFDTRLREAVQNDAETASRVAEMKILLERMQ